MPTPCEPERIRMWIAIQGVNCLKGRGVSYAIVLPGDPTPRGNVDLVIRDARQRIGEVGYWLIGSARGRGLARAATKLLCGWALDTAKLRRLEAMIVESNPDSRSVIEAVGFEYRGPVAFNDGWEVDEQWLLYALEPAA
jgi:RimJ/RimL family protein N-acetyltransferase